jgi:chromosome partitioning protein
MDLEIFDSKRLALRLGVSENITLALLDKGIIKSVKTDGRNKWHIPTFFVELFIDRATQQFGKFADNELCLKANQQGLEYSSVDKNAKIISFGNIKGGVGKTSISTNIAFILAYLGQRVLLVDADAQSNASDFLLDDTERAVDASIGLYPLLQQVAERRVPTREDVMKNILPSVFNEQYDVSLDVMSSDIRLARQLEVCRVMVDGSHKILRRILETVHKDYDFIVIDTPPAPGLALQMSVFASDEMVLVTEASKKSVKGIVELLSEIKYSKNELESNIAVDAIFINRHKPTTNIHDIFTKHISIIAKEEAIKGVYAIKTATVEERAAAENTPLLVYSDEIKARMGTVKSMIEYAVKLLVKGE